MKVHHRIHIMGASGSGTSTLGAAVAEQLALPFVDVDDHYWRQDTRQPYTEKHPPEARVEGIRAAFAGQPGWVLSGSLYSWGQALVPDFTLVVCLQLDPEVRLARIRARECARYGERVQPGGDLYAHSQAFLAWAAGYDEGQGGGRSLHDHLRWLADLDCPVLRLDSAASVADLGAAVMAALASETT